jgi:hypothetical protein
LQTENVNKKINTGIAKPICVVLLVWLYVPQSCTLAKTTKTIASGNIAHKQELATQ